MNLAVGGVVGDFLSYGMRDVDFTIAGDNGCQVMTGVGFLIVIITERISEIAVGNELRLGNILDFDLTILLRVRL